LSRNVDSIKYSECKHCLAYPVCSADVYKDSLSCSIVQDAIEELEKCDNNQYNWGDHEA